MVQNSSRHPMSRLWPRLAAIVILAIGLWCFPLFHVAPLVVPAVVSATNLPVVAETFWTQQLLAAAASDASLVAVGLQRDAPVAIKTYAHPVGLGGRAYFFLRGEGRVVARTRETLQLVLGDGASVVELQIGPIFGNTVRDATGLLDVNQFSSLQDFNLLAVELNQRVESRVLPVLRARAKVGAQVGFTGCAEAVGAGAGRPVLSIIPVRAEVY
jgi:predicted lipoprotein